jgi:hypothetical protein
MTDQSADRHEPRNQDDATIIACSPGEPWPPRDDTSHLEAT